MNAEVLSSIIDHDLPAAAGGDRAAYSRIVSACQNSVTSIALAMVRDVHASEDIAQEAFLSAWQNIRKLQNPSSFLPWLRQITRNLANDHLRSRQRQPRGVDDVEAAIAAAADPEPSTVEQLIEAERTEVAAELISALPDESREVLLLYYREGQSSQQVAALLGLSDAAVRKRLSRARSTVRSELLDRFAVFARASAPSVGFTTMVASALGVIAPTGTTTAVVAASSIGSSLAGKFGAGGLGTASASGGVFGGSLAFIAERVLSPVSEAVIGAPMDTVAFVSNMRLVLGGIVGGTIGGGVVFLLFGRYLLSFAGTPAEHRAIAGLLRLTAICGALMNIALLLAFELSRGWQVPMAVSLMIAVAAVSQWMITAPRRLGPSLDRIQRETGRDPRASTAYRWLLSTQAMVWSSLLMVALVACILHWEGRFG
ncbi:RNA polymerase sigma factor, sigma-70 family protein [Lysobacter antibioticus]|uniref:RNA polymerase sigma factor n=1 Tax=Lysobacter antibioticus TaxID=84531 RepID=UPI00071718B9|nr:sigma-70 family RNA polymerase sigma factor [Lysobacter antibioticus]ALN64744.1 RNA polymerase sigma factor, sigma-70 family protein [Lysobacter antibioticus]